MPTISDNITTICRLYTTIWRLHADYIRQYDDCMPTVYDNMMTACRLYTTIWRPYADCIPTITEHRATVVSISRRLWQVVDYQSPKEKLIAMSSACCKLQMTWWVLTYLGMCVISITSLLLCINTTGLLTLIVISPGCPRPSIECTNRSRGFPEFQTYGIA